MNKSWFILALLVPGTFFLFYGGPESLQPSRSVKELWNLGHIGYFALFTYLLNQFSWLSRQSILRRWSVTLMIVLLSGIAIELLQYGTHRDPDVGDISRDMLGALLILVFYSPLSSQLTLVWRSTLRFVTSILIILFLMPLSLAIFDESMARSQFPVLSDFNTAMELDRWKGEAKRKRVKLNQQEQDYQLKVQLSTATYSGVGLQYFPSDWSEYEFVSLRFYLPDESPLKLTLRIHDEHHNNEYLDRFNQSRVLNQGWNEWTVSLSEVKNALTKREMDMERIRDISFFSIRLKEPRLIYLDSIYLSRQ